MNKIRLLIIEDNRILRKSMQSMFKKRNDIHLVGNISSSENIVQLTSKLKPDILLIDIILINQKSLQIVKLIREQFKKIKIIVMGLMPNKFNITEYIETGVAGFILKDANSTKFMKTIIEVSRGYKVLPPRLTGLLFSDIVKNSISGSTSSSIDKSVRMTKRELELMDLIADGLTNKEISQKLKISTYTVKSHVHNILEKLALSTRNQVAKYVHLTESPKSSLNNTSLLDE